MINAIKEFGEINIYRNAATILDDVFNLLYRLLPISVGPESKTIVREFRVENGRKDLGNGLLNYAVSDGWDTQLTFSSIRFIDLTRLTGDGL